MTRKSKREIERALSEISTAETPGDRATSDPLTDEDRALALGVIRHNCRRAALGEDAVSREVIGDALEQFDRTGATALPEQFSATIRDVDPVTTDSPDADE